MSKRTDKSDEMVKLVSELESGGYDRQRFPQSHGLSISKLDYWRRCYHRQGRQVSGFVELKGANEPSTLTVVCPNGVSIRIQRQLSPARLRELVTLL